MEVDLGTNTVNEESSDSFESMSAGIGDPRVVYYMLSNFYNNKIRIVAQEYLANARDAHREKGNVDVPCEVTLPTMFSPSYVVRDFGPGISPERIKDIFINVGASTKRDCNGKYIGGFGIGAKCAFCYVDSFEIETYIDGIARSYLFVKCGKDNMPEMFEISSSPTTEKNGTKIIIAINREDIEGIIKYVYSTTQFWDVRPTIINPGVTKTTWIEFECYSKTDTWMLLKNTYDASAVVDGVPYPFTPKALYTDEAEYLKMKSLIESDRIVFFFDPSEVKISPSREGLLYDPSTIINIKRAINDAVKIIKDEVSLNLDKCETLNEAITVIDSYSSIKSIVGNISIWKGIDISAFKFDPDLIEVYAVSVYRSKVSILKSGIETFDLTNSYRNSFYFNDMSDVEMSRVKTLSNYSGLKKILVDKSYDHNNTDLVAKYPTKEDFDKASNDYLENVIKKLNLKYMSDIPKYVRPKREKVVGNIYEFRGDYGNSRTSWYIRNLDLSEFDGYYVKFNRGEAEGYTLANLDKIVRYFGITVYGIPERFLKHLDDDSDATFLNDFIDIKITELMNDIDNNVDSLYARNFIAASKNNYVRFINSISPKYMKLFSFIPELKVIAEKIDKIDKIDIHAETCISLEKRFAFINTYVKKIENKAKPSDEIQINETYPGILHKYYPMLINSDNVFSYGDLDESVIEYIKMMNEFKHKTQIEEYLGSSTINYSI